jgi:hypothetical protein
MSMLTTSQLTPAQRRIRESKRKRPRDDARNARYRLQLPRVYETPADPSVPEGRFP